MTYLKLLKFATREIKKGITHQDVFNSIANHSDLNIHLIAETLRKIPSIPKRRRYNIANYLLGGNLVALYIYEILVYLKEEQDTLIEVKLIYYLILLFPSIGTFFYLRNAHYYTGILLCLGFFFSTISYYIPYAHESYESFIFFNCGSLIGAILSLFLNYKLQTDYSFNFRHPATEDKIQKSQIIFDE